VRSGPVAGVAGNSRLVAFEVIHALVHPMLEHVLVFSMSVFQ
jgi:hypothetical protein